MQTHYDRGLCRGVLLAGAALLYVAGVPVRAAEKDDPSRWEKAIRAFEQKDRKNPPPKRGLLFVGSSSIRLWDLPKHFPGRPVINRGFGGSEIADSIHFADRIILKHQPRAVVLYAGDNDIARGKSAKEVTADFKRFVETIHAELPRTSILFIAVKPSIKRWNLAETMKAANARIEKLCAEDDRLVFVDVWKPMLGNDGKPRKELFAKDGLHLNQSGYRLWASILKPRLAAE